MVDANMITHGEKHISQPIQTQVLGLACVYSLPLTVSKRDALRGHLEVDGGRSWQRVGCQRLTYGLGNGLRPGQRLHVDRVDVENVARYK